MADPEQARLTQLANIEQRTSKTLAQLVQIISASGLTKHGEQVAMLKTTLGMGHGDANTLVHAVRNGTINDPAAAAPANPTDSAGSAATEATLLAAAPSQTPQQVLDVLYTGPKAALRPIHDQLLQAMQAFGEFEAAPKKTYVSYRRKKQFAMIGPATNTRVEVGLNIKDLPENERLQALPAGQMCNYKVRVQEVAEVDAQLLGWIKAAYAAAG
jgi:predicted transport protein